MARQQLTEATRRAPLRPDVRTAPGAALPVTAGRTAVPVTPSRTAPQPDTLHAPGRFRILANCKEPNMRLHEAHICPNKIPARRVNGKQGISLFFKTPMLRCPLQI